MKSYCLWLMPEGETRSSLLDKSDRLYDKFSRFGAIIVEPHITLLSDFRGEEEVVANKVRQLSSFILPININLTYAAVGDNFYKRIYVNVEKTPELMAANKKAQALFGPKSEDYEPHLSLIYGDFDGGRHRALEAVGNSFQDKFLVEKIFLVLFADEKEKNGPLWLKVAEFSSVVPAAAS